MSVVCRSNPILRSTYGTRKEGFEETAGIGLREGTYHQFLVGMTSVVFAEILTQLRCVIAAYVLHHQF